MALSPEQRREFAAWMQRYGDAIEALRQAVNQVAVIRCLLTDAERDMNEADRASSECRRGALSHLTSTRPIEEPNDDCQ